MNQSRGGGSALLACAPSRGQIGAMPLWTEHIETGRLGRERNGLVLLRDDGGRWRLETMIDAGPLLGCRVRVSGVRCGFDVLDVQTMTRV